MFDALFSGGGQAVACFGYSRCPGFWGRSPCCLLTVVLPEGIIPSFPATAARSPLWCFKRRLQ